MTETITADLTIRDATDTDVAFLARIMFAAQRSHLARGVIEYLLDLDGDTTVRFLERMALTDQPHMYHRSRFRIAELRGEPVAALSTYDPTEHGDMPTAAAMFSVFPEFGLEPTDPEGWRRSGVVRSGIVAAHDGPGGPRLVIEHVATLPAFRRRGLTGALLREVLRRAPQEGYTAVQIGCFLGNAPARAAYVATGFEPVAIARSDDWTRELGCDGSELLLAQVRPR